MNALSLYKNIKNKPKKKKLGLYVYSKPTILIVGQKEILKKISYIENEYNLKFQFTSLDEVRNDLSENVIAIIVDEKSFVKPSKGFISTLLSEFNRPIYLLNREIQRSSYYKKMYSEGIKAIINWPKESQILHRLLVETLKPHPLAIGKTSSDKKLSKLVKSHILLRGDYPQINVTVIDSYVFLSGFVKTMYDSELITDSAEQVLGVKTVFSKDIKIRSSKKEIDKELEIKIKKYAFNILGDKRKTLSIKVNRGIVSILGTIDSYHDINMIEDFIKKQKSIKQIVRQVEYSSKRVSVNVKKVKELEFKVKNIFHGVKSVSLNLYGDFVEVSGYVSIKEDVKLVERYLLQSLPIQKVINKLVFKENKY